MRLLVIEDDAPLREYLQSTLEAECFVVDVAADGEAGLYRASTNQYDLLILDYNLPKKNGLEVCRVLREEGKTMPILLLSVVGEVDTKVELLNAGADDYLTKPFSLQELLARVRALLRRPVEVKQEALKMGEITLDAQRHSVLVGKKDIYLTRKEFMLLEFLMRNTGKVVSRSEIMEHVWDINADPFSNTIETHILSLRKKVEFGKKKYIHTVSGRGYKFDALRP